MSRRLVFVPLALALIAQAAFPNMMGPYMFNTPEADGVLKTLQVFQKDSAWHEDIRARPRHPEA